LNEKLNPKEIFILSKGTTKEKKTFKKNLFFLLKIFRFEGTLGKDKKTRFKANLANQTCLTDMSEQFSLPMVYQWLDTVIASFDYYTWVFSQGFLNPLLFQGKF
jgi:hypothetical protein